MLRKSLFNLLILLPICLFSQINENKTKNIKISEPLPVNCEKKTYDFKREKYIFNLAEKKTYNIKRAKSPAKIDGVLDDKIWIDCEIGNNFSELKPKNGLTERNGLSTEVKMSFDDKYFYVAAKMFDSCPDSILKELSVRDEENKNFDAFGIYINPFNDGQIEYNFMVTAAGVQIDKKITKTDDDKTWNAVWKSAVSINQEGWIAEIAIPFSQLRFSEKNKIWSVNMIRKIRRYREDYCWNPINVKYSDYSLQAGLINGINNINPPPRISFMPYASVYLEKENNETLLSYNYGMDLKYGINKSFTLDMTLIPDFGQVSSDAMVLNLSPFEVKYEEKRQFFNEGTELFNKGQDMFYSRRIQDDLLNASKITGRTEKGLGLSFLNAITNKTDNDPLTNYNVIIFDQAIDNGSSVSFMNTNMIKSEEKVSNVLGLFTRITNKLNTHTFNGKIKMSSEFENDTIINGYAGQFSIQKTNGNYRYMLYSSIEDNNYNPNDVGFLYSNNEISNGLSLSYHQVESNKKFISSKLNTKIHHEALFTGQNFIKLFLETSARATLLNYTSFSIELKGSPFEENDFFETRSNDFNTPVKKSKYISIGSWISTDYRKKFAIDIGGGINIKPLYSGYGYRWRISPRVRINDKISLKYVLSVKNQYNDIGFVNHDTSFVLTDPPQLNYIFGKRNTFMITNVISSDFIINNKINIALKLRYHIDQVQNNDFLLLNNEGFLNKYNYNENHDINYNIWTSDIAFNWRFAPGSQLALVWKNSIDNLSDEIVSNWIKNVTNTFELYQQNSISLKLIYYLDYLYMLK